MGEMIRRNKVEDYAKNLQEQIDKLSSSIEVTNLELGKGNEVSNQLLMQKTLLENLLYDYKKVFSITVDSALHTIHIQEGHNEKNYFVEPFYRRVYHMRDGSTRDIAEVNSYEGCFSNLTYFIDLENVDYVTIEKRFYLHERSE